MKNNHFSLIAAALGLVLFPALAPQGGPTGPKAETPILLSSCGQSPGPVMLKVILQKLGFAYELNSLATAADLEVQSEVRLAPVKTLIIVMGASLKGMGAAGISIDDEIKRCSDLIVEAKREKRQGDRRPHRGHEEAFPGRRRRRHDRRTDDRRRRPEIGHPPDQQGRRFRRPLHRHRQDGQHPLDLPSKKTWISWPSSANSSGSRAFLESLEHSRKPRIAGVYFFRISTMPSFSRKCM